MFLIVTELRKQLSFCFPLMEQLRPSAISRYPTGINDKADRKQAGLYKLELSSTRKKSVKLCAPL